MMIDIKSFDLETLPSLLLEEKSQLPNCPAVYLAIDINDVVLYVGQSVDLKKRWYGHHHLQALKDTGEIRIAWIEVSEVALIPNIEQALITHFQPRLNGSKSKSFGYRGYVAVGTDLPPDIYKRYKLALADMKCTGNRLINALIVNFLDENNY